MVGIDESLDFKPVTVAVLTVSDTRTRENDTSGDILQARIEAAGHKVTGREIVRDTIEGVRAQLQSFSVVFHQESFKTIGLSTLQSRACAGLAQGTIIFCLPGSNGAVKDGWDKVIAAQLDNRHRPCNSF